jgi:O-antigen/teichoic acid export membrane protein
MDGKRSFSGDVLWNVGGLGVAGVCGVAVNYWLGVAYGASALGVFNQVYAIYIVFSQLAVLGVHGSVLYEVAARPDPRERASIVSSALVLTVGLGVAMAAVFLAVTRPFADLLDSADVATGMVWAAPGLVCFALNKVAMAALNGVQRMRAYAVFQAGRVLLMAAGLGGCIALHVRPSTLPVILTIGEGTTLVLALFTIRDLVARPSRSELGRWGRAHLRFGARGFLSGLFGELNTRIDIIILGAFASDALVGAYSLAALVAEGMYQVLIALRTNYAPIMVRLLVRRDDAELGRVLRKARDRTYAGSAALGALAALGYALIIPHVARDPDLARSWVYFAIVIAGMVAASGYTPFNQLLLWAGRPGWHTVMIVIVVASSAAACTALVATAGATGAACAVAFTYAASVVVLKQMVARVLDLHV